MIQHEDLRTQGTGYSVHKVRNRDVVEGGCCSVIIRPSYCSFTPFTWTCYSLWLNTSSCFPLLIHIVFLRWYQVLAQIDDYPLVSFS